MKRVVFEKLGAKLDWWFGRTDKYKFVKYLKNIIRYYFYHLVKQKVFVSKHIILLEKEFVLEKSNGREIKLEKNKKNTNWYPNET